MPTQDQPVVCYRIELEGELGADWAAWFGAYRIDVAQRRTALEVQVADQAALHGILRRVHDLHLQIISINRIDTGITCPEPEP